MAKGSTSGIQQGDRFIVTARSRDCDEDEVAFKAKLGVIAWQKSKDPLNGGEGQ